MTDPCRKYTHLLGAYVDGELEPSSVLDVDEHVSRCETCGERIELDRAIRSSLKRSVGAASAPASEALRARISGAMIAAAMHEHVREEAHAQARDNRLLSWRTAVPLSVAASLALVWGAAMHGPIGRTTSTAAVSAGADFDLDDLVQEHSHPLPPERTDPKDVRDFERYVGVPVRPVSFEKRSGARLVGGRMIPIRKERAAVLQYEISNGPEIRRVSILVYDPHRIQVHESGLEPRSIGTAEVQVAQSSGYTLAVAQGQNVGYAVASDLDAEKNAELAALAENE